MSEMVERVARAICRAEVKRLGYSGDPKFFEERFWLDHTPSARAAIEAMREPTEAMLKAYVLYADRVRVSGNVPTVPGGWADMIDAALS